ncbi:MAG: hypothetical protein ACKOZU_09130 [Planctomycetaceae bacterium]
MGRRSRLLGTGAALLGGALVITAVACGAVYAYCRCFSVFAWYDDQGFLMLYLQNVLEGHPHYRQPEMVDIYGPWYYLIRWVPHGLFGTPLTTDAVRLISVVLQVACSLMLGLSVFVLRAGRTGGLTLAVACFASCIVHLKVFGHEPGHAQEAITVSMCLCALLAASASPRPGALCLIVGLATGVVLLCKVNVGIYLAVAATLAILRHSPPTWWWLGARRLTLAVALALPVLLVRQYLPSVTFLSLATVVPASIAGVWLAAGALVPRLTLRPRPLLGGVAGAAISLAIGLGFMWWRGTPPWRTLHSIVVLPATFAATAQRGAMPLGATAMLAAAVSLVLAAGHAFATPRRESTWFPWVVVALKLSLGGMALLYDAVPILRWGTPLVWVALVPPPGRTFTSRERVWRELFCFVAALQALQVFPMPGSQVAIATVLLMPLGILCLTDVVDAWERAWTGRPWPGRTGGAMVCAAVAITSVGSLWHTADATRKHYRAGSPLRAAGAERMRLPERESAAYQWLIDNARESPDTFVCTMAPHCLYFWTERRPMTLAVTGHGWNFFPAAMQRNLMALYASRPDVLAVDFESPSPNPSARRAIPFYRLFDADYVPLGRVGPWALLTHRATGRRWRLTGCSYRGPAVRALDMDTRAERATQLPSELDLVLAAEQANAGATAFQVVDLDGNAVLADSRDPARPARLLDARGTQVLPAPDRATAGLAGRDGEALRIVVNAETALAPGFPAVRFFDAAGRRLFTLPIAVARDDTADRDEPPTGSQPDPERENLPPDATAETRDGSSRSGSR